MKRVTLRRTTGRQGHRPRRFLDFHQQQAAQLCAAHVFAAEDQRPRCRGLPDNVLFEGGAGEKIRKNLLEKCNVHTLLRLPTGIWYSPGVKANVLFFDKKEGRPEPWIDKLWVYDLRTNKHFTQKLSPITREDFDDFVACYQPGAMHKRKPTWSEENPDGRWRCYDYDEILKRDKLSLDLFWIKDQSLTDTDSLPAPDILAAEIADELEAAFDLFTKIAAKLPKAAA
jgi:type I restriction enzyme M protein